MSTSTKTAMQVTFTVTEADVTALRGEAGAIERALHRALLKRFPQVDIVHEGSDEIGFLLDGQTYECVLSEKLRDRFDELIYMQRPAPETFRFRFKKV